MSFSKNKLGNIQKTIIFVIIFILILPLGILALENSTTNSTDLNNSISSSVETNNTVETNGSMQIDTSLKNESAEELQPLNETSNNTDIGNNSLNENSSNSDLNENEVKVNIEIIYPTKIIRGENFELRGDIENIGKVNVQNAYAEWVLPKSFEIVQGEKTLEINQLEKGDSLTLNLEVKASELTLLGKNEIKLLLKNGQ